MAYLVRLCRKPCQVFRHPLYAFYGLQLVAKQTEAQNRTAYLRTLRAEISVVWAPTHPGTLESREALIAVTPSVRLGASNGPCMRRKTTEVLLTRLNKRHAGDEPSHRLHIGPASELAVLAMCRW